MGFFLIKGTFVPGIGNPDGDSVRFIADDLANWAKLTGRGDDPGERDSVQLRFEGIDAIEKKATQPLARQALESMKALIGHGAATPEPRGYVLAKRFEGNGRPVCFVFAGEAGQMDGEEVFLDAAMLRTSVNYLQTKAGFSYPLFYNTLFRELRETLGEAWQDAQANGRGYCPTDASLSGVTVNSRADLATIAPVWPKLWRRLEEYLRTPRNLSGFLSFLQASGERADNLITFEQQSINHFFDVTGNKVKMTVPPERIRVVSSN
jgi:hypothetical protein